MYITFTTLLGYNSSMCSSLFGCFIYLFTQIYYFLGWGWRKNGQFRSDWWL